MKRKSCDPNLKILASVVNCGLVTLISLPIYMMADLESWKLAAVSLFFAYNLLFRKRCLGCMVVGTRLERPASLRYILLYTTSYSSFFYSVYAPFDLLVINGLVFQIPTLAIAGNTCHGYFGDQWTVREA